MFERRRAQFLEDALIGGIEWRQQGAKVAATTTKVFETWILVGGMYFVLCYAFATLFVRLERRARKSLR